MADKIRFEKLNIKLPKISDGPIPPENYVTAFHNPQSRLNLINNQSDFNNHNCFTASTVFPVNKQQADEKEEKAIPFRAKRLRTEENINDRMTEKPVRREHTDLFEDPVDLSPLDSIRTFQIHFTEKQLETYKKNRHTLSYVSTESSSSASFTASATQRDGSSSDKIYRSSSSSFEGSHQGSSDNSTYILPRRESLDSISLASALDSPELNSKSSNNNNSNSNNTNSNDEHRTTSEDDNDDSITAAEDSFSISTTSLITRTTTIDQSLTIIREEEVTEELSISD